ncbi:hypothetical protein [uncultured Dysosmobacter sp.]|uniref:hypothetical protein n=1 Tax=uncultured Dysosmobacter sp. TaxID=2591384 RepID=UPI00262E708A|nr:hypothetical protein [uncultured Dysosmobacter sp.]
MDKKEIVEIRYCGQDGQPRGKAYSYYTDIPLAVGDRVIVPTYKGDGEGVVCAVAVPESTVDEHVLPLLKTITRKVEAE